MHPFPRLTHTSSLRQGGLGFITPDPAIALSMTHAVIKAVHTVVDIRCFFNTNCTPSDVMPIACSFFLGCKADILHFRHKG